MENAKPSVLSLGYTRDLWEEGEKNDTRSRLEFYASHLERYTLITNSYKRHGLRALARGNMELRPTDAHTPVDSFLRMLLLGRSLLRRHRFTIIQAQDPILTGFAAVLLGKASGVPVNVCVYGPNVFDPYWVASHWSNRFLAPIGRWVLRRASSVQVDGRLTARRLRAALGPKVPIYSKPVVPQHFGRLLELERRPSTPGVFRMLFAGRLEAQKNIPLLAEAVARLHATFAKEGVSVELDVLGDGSLRPAFEKRLASEIAAGAVRMHGMVGGSALPEAFSRADMLILSSYYEGFPRVLMEAAAAGIPIVTTAISGSDEAVVDGETGFITPIGDLDALVEKVSLLVRDAGLREAQGARGREHIQRTLQAGKGHAEQLRIWEEVGGV